MLRGPVLDGAVRHPDQQRGLVAFRCRVVRHGVAGGGEAGRGAGQVLQLELAVGRGERVGLQGCARWCCASSVSAKELPSSCARRFMPGGARQVVEPVTVLQVGQLVLEDVVERAAQQAAEQVGPSRRGRRPRGRCRRGRWSMRCRRWPSAPVLFMNAAASSGADLAGEGVRADDQPGSRRALRPPAVGVPLQRSEVVGCCRRRRRS